MTFPVSWSVLSFTKIVEVEPLGYICIYLFIFLCFQCLSAFSIEWEAAQNSGTIVSCIADYLSDRPQFVNVVSSAVVVHNKEASQGTVIFAFLFILHAPDFQHNSEAFFTPAGWSVHCMWQTKWQPSHFWIEAHPGSLFCCSSSTDHWAVPPKQSKFLLTPMLKWPTFSRIKHIYSLLQKSVLVSIVSFEICDNCTGGEFLLNHIR